MSLEDLIGKIGDVAAKNTPWYNLPVILGLPALAGIRNRMRAENLYDTEEPPLNPAHGAPPPDVLTARSYDGSFNDLNFPQMGAAGARFGRNFPLALCFPDRQNLLVPNPRLVSSSCPMSFEKKMPPAHVAGNSETFFCRAIFCAGWRDSIEFAT